MISELNLKDFEPLEDSSYNYDIIHQECLLEEFKDVKKSFLKMGWDNEKIKTILKILEKIRIDHNLFAISAPAITYHMLNKILLEQDVFRALLGEIKKYQSNESIKDFYEYQQVGDFFGIVFLFNVWIGQKIANSKPDLLRGNPHFWFKSALLAYQSFVCSERVSSTNLQSNLYHYYDDKDLHIQTEEANISELTNDRSILILRKAHVEANKGITKDKNERGKLKEKTKKYYFESVKGKIENPQTQVNELMKFMKKESFFDCEPIADSERGSKTVKGWIKSWDTEICALSKLNKGSFLIQKIKELHVIRDELPEKGFLPKTKKK